MMFDDTLISIHAPTRGATILCNHRGLVFGFQSTLPREERQIPQIDPKTGEQFQSTLPREERRVLRIKGFYQHFLFQSTLPREERRMILGICPPHPNFNPRSHERSDYDLSNADQVLIISIHAPTRGATAILHKKFVYFYTIPTINI